MHTATPRALGYFLRSYRKTSFLAQMVYKTKGQVLFFFFFFSSQHLLTTVENRGQLRTKKKVSITLQVTALLLPYCIKYTQALFMLAKNLFKATYY